MPIGRDAHAGENGGQNAAQALEILVREAAKAPRAVRQHGAVHHQRLIGQVDTAAAEIQLKRRISRDAGLRQFLKKRIFGNRFWVRQIRHIFRPITTGDTAKRGIGEAPAIHQLPGSLPRHLDPFD